MKRFIDATVGRWIRHFFFLVVRGYYTFFYNVSCAGKHLLHDTPGALVLSTHVSRHDGPMIVSLLYTTCRVRPVVHYNEYHHWAQHIPLWVISALPVSSPRDWPADKRAEHKDRMLGIIGKVIANGKTVLLFPGGKARRQPEELVPPHYTGAYDLLQANPDIPVMLLRIDGLGQFQTARYDNFWSFLFLSKGRRHVSIDIRPVTSLNLDQDVEGFNRDLETMLNTTISTDFPG